ncbi:helix-turn-helix transcriptional regulator [Amycolatopsis alba]|nr:helix-turn-helix transcriptional regulator [Amycolatopsis alba]
MKEPRRALVTDRERAGHTQESLATALGVDVKTVRNWENGTYKPRTPDLHRRLAEELRITRRQLTLRFDHTAHNEIDPPDQLAEHQARPPRLASVLEEALDSEEADRLSYSLHWPESVDHSTLDILQRCLTYIRHAEDDTSSSAVIPVVGEVQRIANSFANASRASIRRHATGLLSEVEQYRGWLAIPSRDWHTAQRHLDRATVVALESDDPLRLSTALSFSAYSALRRFDLSSADALSEAALRDKRVHAGLRAYELFQRAEILARSALRKASVALLLSADGLVEHLPDDTDLPSSGYWYTPPFFLGQKAFVLRALGDYSGARQAAVDCLAEMPPDWSESEWAARRRELAGAG